MWRAVFSFLLRGGFSPILALDTTQLWVTDPWARLEKGARKSWWVIRRIGVSGAVKSGASAWKWKCWPTCLHGHKPHTHSHSTCVRAEIGESGDLLDPNTQPYLLHNYDSAA